MELYLALRRRGFVRVATPATCRLPRKQHAVAFVTSQNSMAATEPILVRVAQFLSENASIAVLIESREGEFAFKVQRKLEQMGFRIEAGVRCPQGLVLSAYRLGFAQMAMASVA
jgi:hypothetical protein